ncbi:isopentenyl-diphosphate Delta-isomerase [Salibaculum griseiflavum]|uniref:Isopentenyl-diphosphate Delta-isomerase n=1 Tax=Salibaculum griseiflavum TaxID=1914409 RepID=A0A2V1NZP6_9RHOB|nr:NUDIX domain-containing protein [Salibaculum griseiflavum]PWG15793.1 isopentenyl-diphosphate delta-isomerase [Salibaculum griseiflavum]
MTTLPPNAAMIPAWLGGDLVALDKMRVHREGLRHKAVSVFVQFGEDLLLQRRALAKYHTPGLWANACCTHPHWGESPLECATRRLDEELGLSGLDLYHQGQVEYRADVGGDLVEHEVVDLFLARVAARPIVTPNPEEVMAVDWMPLRQLEDAVRRRPEDFTPWLRIYLDRHAGQIFA